ncbi:MAG TPA: hypothetical protein VEW03_12830 [Longimicrobiaceae bacterium]|nr:hypothetical protein [Longimicrobiaceae bacterium]
MNTTSDGHNGQDAASPLNDRVQLAAVAAFLAYRSKRTSLRKLAREIGVSKSSVEEMVTAYNQVRELPQPSKNLPKLRAWYLKTKREEAGQLDDPADMAMLMLEVIADMPEAAQRRSLQRLVDFVGQMYDDEKAPHPPWLERLEEGLRGGGTDGHSPTAP